MNEGRRRQLGKLAFDIAKYFTTLMGGTLLLKPDVISPGLAWKAALLILGFAVFGWLVYPKGKE